MVVYLSTHQDGNVNFIDYGPIAKRGLDKAYPVSKTWYPTVQQQW